MFMCLFFSALCRYICTCNLNQDPLEMYFSCIRQRGGWNNNPSAAQFRLAYRKTLVHAAVLGSQRANVQAQLEGITLSSSQGQRRSACSHEDSHDNPALIPTVSQQAALDHDYFHLSEFSREVVQYIGGYVVRSITKQLHCTECAGLLVSDNITSLLAALKDNGGLIEPSRLVHIALQVSENIIRRNSHNANLRAHALTLKAFSNFAQQHSYLFEGLEHYCDNPSHITNLIRVVIHKYVVLRLKAIARRISEENKGLYIRHKLTKQVLFAHQ